MLKQTTGFLHHVRRLLDRPALDVSHAELIEIRDAIVEDVASRCHVLAGGTIFPFAVIEAGIYSATEDRRLVVENNLGAASGLPADIRRAIERQGCEVPGNLQVKVYALEERPADADWHIEYSAAPRDREDLTVKPGRQPYLVLVSGEAQQTEFRLEQGTYLVGRGAEVRFSSGIRRNHIAFLETTSAGRSVSRDHARIDCGADGCCALIQQNKHNTTEIRRPNSRPYPLSAMGRPTRLHDGDEIRLGEALLRFELR